MKTKEELAKEIEAMANSFKLIVMEDWMIESMLKDFALTVQLYQLLIKESNYKLSSKENDLLKTVTK